jgi:hypothetical protein
VQAHILDPTQVLLRVLPATTCRTHKLQSLRPWTCEYDIKDAARACHKHVCNQIFATWRDAGAYRKKPPLQGKVPTQLQRRPFATCDGLHSPAASMATNSQLSIVTVPWFVQA